MASRNLAGYLQTQRTTAQRLGYGIELAFNSGSHSCPACLAAWALRQMTLQRFQAKSVIAATDRPCPPCADAEHLEHWASYDRGPGFSPIWDSNTTEPSIYSYQYEDLKPNPQAALCLTPGWWSCRAAGDKLNLTPHAGGTPR